jgi:hypothetical protein
MGWCWAMGRGASLQWPARSARPSGVLGPWTARVRTDSVTAPMTNAAGQLAAALWRPSWGTVGGARTGGMKEDRQATRWGGGTHRTARWWWGGGDGSVRQCLISGEGSGDRRRCPVAPGRGERWGEGLHSKEKLSPAGSLWRWRWRRCLTQIRRGGTDGRSRGWRRRRCVLLPSEASSGERKRRRGSGGAFLTSGERKGGGGLA